MKRNYAFLWSPACRSARMAEFLSTFFLLNGYRKIRASAKTAKPMAGTIVVQLYSVRNALVIHFRVVADCTDNRADKA